MRVLGIETTCDETAAAVAVAAPRRRGRNPRRRDNQPDRGACRLWRRRFRKSPPGPMSRSSIASFRARCGERSSPPATSTSRRRAGPGLIGGVLVGLMTRGKNRVGGAAVLGGQPPRGARPGGAAGAAIGVSLSVAVGFRRLRPRSPGRSRTSASTSVWARRWTMRSAKPSTRSPRCSASATRRSRCRGASPRGRSDPLSAAPSAARAAQRRFFIVRPQDGDAADCFVDRPTFEMSPTSAPRSRRRSST